MCVSESRYWYSEPFQEPKLQTPFIPCCFSDDLEGEYTDEECASIAMYYELPEEKNTDC